MTELARRIAEHCDRHRLLPAGRPVLAMVSGGADSLCMLHVLRAVHDGPVGVLSIDHGLRPEAAGEVEEVARVADGLGCRIHRASLGLEPGAGLQRRAREARLAAAEDAASRHGYERIAIGHTASDQAETVLFRIARGTGRTGALGMAPRRGPFVRPLLSVTREETAAWCRAHGLAASDDPSNHDERSRRVRVRRRVLPALEDVHPEATRHVAALADLLRDERELLDPLVDEAWARCAREGGLDAERLAREPGPMRRLLARRLVTGAGLPSGAGERRHLERVLDLVVGGGRVSLPGGGGAAVERGVLMAFGPEPPPPAAASLPVPGRARFGALSVSAEAGRGHEPSTDRVAVAHDGPFQVRAPRPGDRVALAGGGRRPVGRLLADAGVPARLRERVPVVASGELVVWVVGHRAAADLLATADGPATVLTAEPAA